MSSLFFFVFHLIAPPPPLPSSKRNENRFLPSADVAARGQCVPQRYRASWRRVFEAPQNLPRVSLSLMGTSLWCIFGSPLRLLLAWLTAARLVVRDDREGRLSGEAVRRAGKPERVNCPLRNPDSFFFRRSACPLPSTKLGVTGCVGVCAFLCFLDSQTTRRRLYRAGWGAEGDRI